MDNCCICQEELTTEVYQVPECGHKFHTKCVIDWFRFGNSKCPMCNTAFSSQSTDLIDEEYSIWHPSQRNQFKYKEIYNFSKRKETCKKIKKQVQQITDKNKKIIDISTEITKLKSNKTYIKISKEIRKLETKKWRVKSSIRKRKRKLCDEVKIIPTIIRKRIK